MWKSIKNFFGFGKTKVVVEAPVVKAPKKKAKAKDKPEIKEEVKVTVKEIKAKVKEKPVADKPVSKRKPRKPKSEE